MTQADRDRLVTLKKAASGAIRQWEAAAELKVCERQMRRLLASCAGRRQGHLARLRGRRSNRKIDEERAQQEAILQQHVYRGFGPTLAGECLDKKHGIQVSKRDGSKNG